MSPSTLSRSFISFLLLFFVFSIYSFAQEQISNNGFPDRWQSISRNLSITNDVTKGAILFSATHSENEGSGGQIQSIISPPAADEVTIKFKVWVEQIGNGLNLTVNVLNKNDVLKSRSLTLGQKDLVANQWNYITLNIDDYRMILLQGANLLHLQLTVGGNVKLWLKDIQVYTENGIYTGSNTAPVFKADMDEQFNSGSKIDVLNTKDDTLLNNLDILGKVWGYMKYYHPVVRMGEYNWDYELFKILPKVVSVRSHHERNKLLLEWVASFPYTVEYPKDINRSITNSRNGFLWLDKATLGDSLYVALDRLKYLKKDSTSYYMQYNGSMVVPSHENAYSNMRFPDAGLRLLTAFRLWNHINYFYAYKGLLKSSWDKEMTPLMMKFLKAKNEQQYFQEFLAMIASFKNVHVDVRGDENAFYLENLFWGKNWLPAQVKFIKDKPYVVKLPKDPFLKNSGLELGDQVISINGTLIGKLIRDRSDYLSGAHPGTKGREYTIKLFRTNDTVMNLVVKRNEKMVNLKIDRFLNTVNQIEDVHTKNGLDTVFIVLDKNVGYMNCSIISDSALVALTPQILNTKGLILDLRGYPIALNIRKFLSDHFFPKKMGFSTLTYSDPFLPGAFLTKNDSVGKENPDYYKHKVILLVNEYTQSHPEYLTMIGQQMPNSLVIGSTTAGADGNRSPLRLPGGLITSFESVGVYKPDGGETQQVGLKPGEVLYPDIKGLRSGLDFVLTKALSMFK